MEKTENAKIKLSWDGFSRKIAAIQDKILAIRRESAEKHGEAKLKQIRDRLHKI